MVNSLLLLFVLTGCSVSQFDPDSLVGVWGASDHQFIYDDCDLVQAISPQDTFQYTFVSAFSVENENDTGLQFEPTDLPSESTIVDRCYLDKLDEPSFDCRVSTILVHYNSWKDSWPKYAQAESQDCSFQFTGETEGIFINQEQIFITGQLNVRCLVDGNVTADDTGGESASEGFDCSSTFTSDLNKQ